MIAAIQTLSAAGKPASIIDGAATKPMGADRQTARTAELNTWVRPEVATLPLKAMRSSAKRTLAGLDASRREQTRVLAELYASARPIWPP